MDQNFDNFQWMNADRQRNVHGAQETVGNEGARSMPSQDDQGNNQRKRPRVETPGVSRQEQELSRHDIFGDLENDPIPQLDGNEDHSSVSEHVWNPPLFTEEDLNQPLFTEEDLNQPLFTEEDLYQPLFGDEYYEERDYDYLYE